MSVEISDLSSYTSTELTRQITDLSNYTSTELTRQITDLSGYTSTELTRQITDLSDYTSTELTRQITDLSGYTSTELTRQITDLSGYTSTELTRQITDISDYTSTELTRQISDLSSYTSTELTRQITDLSDYTSTELTRQITDLSGYASTELTRQITDLSSESVRDISDLSSLTFYTLSVEISDLSDYTSTELTRQITDLSSYASTELTRQISDLSSYTSTELTRQISDLSSYTSTELTRQISDLSNYTSTELTRQISDLSSYTSTELTRQISDLSDYTSTELTRQIADLSSESVRDINDLSTAVFAKINVEIADLLDNAPGTLDTLKEIADVLGDPTDSSGGIGSILTKLHDISARLLTSIGNSSADLNSQITDLSNYTSTELSRQISDLSSDSVRDISDLSSLTFHTLSVEISDLSSYTSTELTRQITDLSNYTSTELTRQITDLSDYTSTELTRQITDLSDYTSTELTRQITDLSDYTSTELTRQISDLSSESVRDISDLSSLTFHTLSVEISDLSDYTSTELTRQITDLSGYASTELTRQITDLSDYTSTELTRQITDLSGYASTDLTRQITDLSDYTSTELTRQITDLSDYTSTEVTRQITDLSGYASTELTRQITDLSGYASTELTRQITDLSDYTSTELTRQISDLSSYTSTELTRQISDLSSESIRDISDLSSLVFLTIASNTTDNSSSFFNVDASFTAINNLLSTEISSLSNETMRDISDLSSQVFQTIDDLPWDSDTNYLYTASNTQNVGIGTATPTSKLQVTSTDQNTAAEIMIQNSNYGEAALYLTNRPVNNTQMQNGLGLRFQAATQEKTFFDVYYNNTTPTQLMVLNHTASKVGINTDNPTATLEINGDIKINGSITDVSGNVFDSLDAAFVDTFKGITIEPFTGSVTTDKLYNDNGILSFNGLAVAPSNLTFPIGNGDANQVLETDGSGNLSWVTNHDIYITKNPNHDTKNGVGYTNLIKKQLNVYFANGRGIMTFVKLGVRRFIYYARTDGHVIRRYDIENDLDSFVAGSLDTLNAGSPYPGRVDGKGSNVRFTLMSDIRYNPYDGFIYISCLKRTWNGVEIPPSLRRLNPITSEVTTMVQDTTLSGHASTSGSQSPINFSFDNSGNVYYGSSHYGWGIKKFDIATLTQSSFIGGGELSSLSQSDDDYTFGIVWDNSNNGYLIHSHAMSKLTPISGVDLSYNTSTVYFGDKSYSGAGQTDGTGTSARVSYISHVVKDADPNSNALYVACSGRLLKVVPNPSNDSQGIVSTIVGITGGAYNDRNYTRNNLPTTSPGTVEMNIVTGLFFDDWGNLMFITNNSNSYNHGDVISYAGIPYIEVGTQPVLPGDSITRLTDISINDIEFGEFLKWDGESIVPGEPPNRGRGGTLPNLNFTLSNVRDQSSNMLFNGTSKYLLLDKLITIDKVRINQKSARSVNIGYNVYIKEHNKSNNALVNTQTKIISNAVVEPVETDELYGTSIVDISATTFTNRNYLEILIEKSTGYVYSESANTTSLYNFDSHKNSFLSDVDISDNANTHAMSLKSVHEVIEENNETGLVISDSSDNYIKVPSESGADIHIKAVSFWIKNWTGGCILDGRNVLSHTNLEETPFVEYAGQSDISSGTGISKFVNQSSVPYDKFGMGGDNSGNTIGLLHKNDWNFVYVEFDSSGAFTSTNPLLLGTSIHGDGGSYTMRDLRIHGDSILNNDIVNLYNSYDDMDVIVELITTPNERLMSDLSDVSDVVINAGEMIKFDGTFFVPTTDVIDISSSLNDLSGHVYNLRITDLCDCFVGDNNCFLGIDETHGTYNTAIGFEVMDQATDDIQYNTAVGYRALYNTTSNQADNNTAVGSQALANVSTGYNNVAVGSNAAKDKDSNNSIFIGAESGQESSFNSSVIIGNSSSSKVAQSQGIIIGYNSGNTTDSGYTNYNAGGTRNTVVGSDSMKKMTTGDDNVIIGAYSSNNLTTGYQNVIIGANSSSNKATTNNLPSDIYNAVGIGFESYPTASNTIRLGNANHTNINTSATLTLGEITIPTTDGGKNTFLITDGSGNLSFTNYEVKPHLSNVTFDGSNAIIVEFSRDILYSTNYDPNDFKVVHDGSSIAVLSVYELNTKLAINVGGSVVPGQPIVTPSYDLASQTSTLYSGSTSQYSHSSYYPDAQEGYNAFDAGTRSSAPHGGANVFVWSSITGVYNNNTLNGSYGGSVTTTVDGVSVAGEWIQVDVGQSVVVKTFKHLPSTSGDYGYVNSRQVRNAIFATSTDNSTWKQIGSVSFTSIPTTESTHTTSSNTVGRYFRYIVTSGHGNSNVQVKELTLLGVTEAQYNAENPPPVVDPLAVDVPIDLDKLKFTYTKSVDGSNNIVTTDGFRLGSFYYNGLGLTNLTNEEFSDLSDISLNATTLVSGHMIQYNGTQFTNIEPTITDISFNSALLPDITNTRDIGSTSRKIKDMHVAGTIDVSTTITTSQLSVGTATYPNTYGNINQFLRSNNTGTLFWSHVYLNDLYDVNTASFSNNSYLNYSSSSNAWVVTNLPNDNLASITQLDQTLTDLSGYAYGTLSTEIYDLSQDTVRDISDLSSIVFSHFSTEIYDLSQETLSDINDLSNAFFNRIDTLIGPGTAAAFDTLKEIEDYITGLSGNTVAGLIEDVIEISGNIPYTLNDLTDVNTTGISTGNLVKWDGSSFTNTSLLHDKSNGYIGIGTNNPGFPLTITSYTTDNVNNVGYLDNSGVAIKQSQPGAEISLYAAKGIWSGTSFFASSDLRIKKDIVEMVPETCMELVRKLKPKKYGFVDHIKHGGKEVYGFIAQEVLEICPNVVTTQKEFIPDIFKAVENISWSRVDKKWKLTIHDISGFRENTVVRFYLSDRKNNELMKDVVNCRNEPNSFLFDKIYEDIFIYGHQVSDFLALDKEQIFTLHHGAILLMDEKQQQMEEKQQQMEATTIILEEENRILKEENGDLKKQVDDMFKQLQEIKTHLGI